MLHRCGNRYQCISALPQILSLEERLVLKKHLSEQCKDEGCQTEDQHILTVVDACSKYFNRLEIQNSASILVVTCTLNFHLSEILKTEVSQFHIKCIKGNHQFRSVDDLKSLCKNAGKPEL